MEKDDKIWYFAYGSNMNPKVLTGRRKIYPIQSIPGYIPGWYLNFDTLGIPYIEPCFASIGQKQIIPNQPEVHGVLHQISRKEYEQIRRTERGSGYDGVGGYSNEQIYVTTYNSSSGTEQILASTLVQCPTYYTIYHEQFWPSKRYIKLIELGSLEFKLNPSYQKWIKTIPYYEPISTIRHSIGKILYLCLVLIISLPILLIMFIARVTNTKGPKWIYIIFSWLMIIHGNIYYFIFRPIFGKGGGEL